MASETRRPWTREELILAINLYCKTPFGKIHVRNPDIIALAVRLGRTPGSVSYKLANFASIDPSLPRKGASNVSKLDREVWKEFLENWDEMAYKGEVLSQGVSEKESPLAKSSFAEGKTRQTVVKARVNQTFFRKMVLAAYNNACCITDLPIAALLVASHIIPWAKDKTNRMNPRNGLCLNSLHDKAFDVGLITIDQENKVKLSPSVKDVDPKRSKLLLEYDSAPIRLPKRFIPDDQFLEYHRKHVLVA